MKRKIEVIAIFLALTAPPFALAQLGVGGVHSSGARFMPADHDSTKINSPRASVLEATGIQREAFASCMMATETARKTGRSMGSNSYWNARHGFYDLSAVYRGKTQLQSGVTEMAATHQQFLNVLNQEQKTALEPKLNKLQQLQTNLNLEMSQLDEELMATRPDKFRASTSVYEIGRTLDKWHSEHKRIAKRISISKP